MKIIITNRKDKSIGARILLAESYSVAALNRIVSFWQNKPLYNVEVTNGND